MNMICVLGQCYRMSQDIMGTIEVQSNPALGEHEGVVIETQQRQQWFLEAQMVEYLKQNRSGVQVAIRKCQLLNKP